MITVLSAYAIVHKRFANHLQHKMTNTGKSSKYLKITLAVFLGFTCYILGSLMVYKESFAMTEKIKIVMIGDSITYGGNWNDLFPTITIENRGVSGNKTEDILKRMEPILALKPHKAFVMAGINDIYGGLSINIIFKNYINIINLLQNQNIIVYIQSTLECSRYYCGDNIEKVRALNNKLTVYADGQKITYININDALTSEKDGLISDYTNDGTHLLDKGYLIWSKTIKPYINAN